jgi:hypothetical protein
MAWQDKVDALREAGAQFAQTMGELSAAIPAMRTHPQGAKDLGELLNDGVGIRRGIESVAKLIDGGKRFVDRTFQTEAMETVPFAEEIVSTAAAGSLSAIQHFQDKARAFLIKAKPRIDKFNSLNAEEKSKLGDAVLPEVEVTAERLPLWRPVLLVAVLGGLYLWWRHTSVGEPNWIDE